MFNFINLDGIPILPRRESNIDKFSMYLMLNTQNGRLVIQWKYQPYLKRNMELYEEMNEGFSRLCRQQDKGIGLAQFWRDVALFKPQPIADWEPANKPTLAWEHLASYFEEKCYWAAKHVCKEYNKHSWEEYLCLARLLVYNPLKLGEILARYDSAKANIDTYVTEALAKHIKYEAEINRFSRWRLLYKKSDKELKEALQISGHCEPEISQVLFARKYFKQVYLVNKVKNPSRQTGKKWPDPDQEDFDKSASCYNAEKLLPSVPHEVSATSTTVTGKQIQDWMEICITALQNYPKLIVPLFSLDALQAIGREAKSEERKNDYKLEWQGTAVVCETGEYFVNKTNSALRQQLETFQPEHQKIMLLYYGFGLKQKQLAVKLGINQSTISRYLAKSTLKLLDTLARVSQPQQWVKQYVTGWLEQDYPAPLHSDLIQAALVSAIKELEPEKREILQLCYGQQMDETKIAHQLGVNPAEVTAKLSQSQHQLQENLMNAINIWIKEYIEKWLSKHYESVVNSVLKTISNVNIELEPEEKINAVVEAYLQNLDRAN